jgi:hypothetical protein
LSVFWNTIELFDPVWDIAAYPSGYGQQDKGPQAELEAHILWDRMYADKPAPDQIDKDACIARMFRRVQLMVELQKAASWN